MINGFPTLISLPNNLSVGLILAIVLIICFSSFVHGLIGVGFPLISTPLIAVLTDVKTAVVLTIVPNIVLNLIFIFRGKAWHKTIKNFLFLALCVTIGTIVGSKLLLYFDSVTLKVLLLLMMLLSIVVSNKNLFELIKINTESHYVQAAFGLLAGVMGGAVNISVPILSVYFVNTEFAPSVISQAFNVCFIFSKFVQAFILIISGSVGVTDIALGVMLSVFAVMSQKPGILLQDKISKEQYKRYLYVTTWFMVVFVFIDIVRSIAH